MSDDAGSSTPAAPDARTAPAMPLDPGQLSPAEARALFRAGLVRPTSGFSLGHAQANLLAVPQDLAFDFLLFAHRNPKPCPVLGVLEAGQVASELLIDGDIRTDVPLYRVYRDGELVDKIPDAREHWREDLVSFLIGCSFTFESALLDAGVPMAHLEHVPVFWACGVTPQAAVMASKPPLAIAHAPGHMLVTDARDLHYQVP